MATYNGHNEDSSGNILLSIGNGMAATVETGSTASQAYTKGALLFFNNRLCKATKAISSGATLAVGTNLSQTSLGAELTSHLRSSDGKEFYFDVKDGTYGYYPSASKVSSEFVPFGGTSGIAKVTIPYNGFCTSKWQISDKIQIDTLELTSEGTGVYGVFEITVPASLSIVSWSSASREMSGTIAIDFNGVRKYNSFTAGAVSITISGGGTLQIFVQGAETKITINDFTIS